MAQPYLKYQISLILSPYLAQRYLAQPWVLAVCACLHHIAQPFLGNIQSFASFTSHDFLNSLLTGTFGGTVRSVYVINAQ